jgi:hypothetical protein
MLAPAKEAVASEVPMATTQVGPDVSMPEFIARREYQFGVHIDAALAGEAAPHVIRIMVQHAESKFMNQGAFVFGV